MQPARGRFARFDLDRQIASTFPAHWKVGPAPGKPRSAAASHKMACIKVKLIHVGFAV